MTGTCRNRTLALVLAIACALAMSVTAPALASNEHPTVEEVSKEVMCPTCGTSVDKSDSPVADRMRSYIRARIADGWTRDEIVDGLVAEFGGDESIRARPPTKGVGSLAWIVPLVFFVTAMAAGAIVVRRWRRAGRDES